MEVVNGGDTTIGTHTQVILETSVMAIHRLPGTTARFFGCVFVMMVQIVSLSFLGMESTGQLWGQQVARHF